MFRPGKTTNRANEKSKIGGPAEVREAAAENPRWNRKVGGRGWAPTNCHQTLHVQMKDGYVRNGVSVFRSSGQKIKEDTSVITNELKHMVKRTEINIKVTSLAANRVLKGRRWWVRPRHKSERSGEIYCSLENPRESSAARNRATGFYVHQAHAAETTYKSDLQNFGCRRAGDRSFVDEFFGNLLVQLVKDMHYLRGTWTKIAHFLRLSKMKLACSAIWPELIVSQLLSRYRASWMQGCAAKRNYSTGFTKRALWIEEEWATEVTERFFDASTVCFIDIADVSHGWDSFQPY